MEASRRSIMLGLTGSAIMRRAFAAGADAGAGAPSATPATPGAALAALLAGNRRFQEKRLTSFSEDLDILRANTVASQSPFAAVLSCADSRVPVEILFDQSIGHVFVTRVAGNIATGEIIASLEYGAAVLGTKLVLVLGHSGCGAVAATIAGKAVPGQISALYRAIRPAVDHAHGDLALATKRNAVLQAALLREASPVLAERVGAGTLDVVAGYYDLATGAVSVLQPGDYPACPT